MFYSAPLGAQVCLTVTVSEINRLLHMKKDTDLFRTTLRRAFPTSLPGTAKAMSSTQVTCRAWAAGLGNSLNLQSQLGKGPGDLPAMGAMIKAKTI